MTTALPSRADGLPVMKEKELDALGGEIIIDGYVPHYGQKCEVCRCSPVVKGVMNGRIAYNGEMCGPCTWGDSSTADPANWNE